MKNRRRDKMLTVQEFRRLFGTERRCGAQLTRQRWPHGFACPHCGGPSRGYMVSRRVHECARCGYQCSVSAGTIFHKTRMPLASWFLGYLSHEPRQEGHLGGATEQGDRRQLSDRLADAAQDSQSDGGPRSALYVARPGRGR